jgi:hypothetical protein
MTLNALEEEFQEQMLKLEKEAEKTKKLSETHGGSKKESIFSVVNVLVRPKPFCPQSKMTLPTWVDDKDMRMTQMGS